MFLWYMMSLTKIQNTNRLFAISNSKRVCVCALKPINLSGNKSIWKKINGEDRMYACEW